LNPAALREIDIFLCEDYRQYIRTRIARTEGSRGLQRQLAEAAKCQPSFLSQALAGSVHLTVDHAAGIADFWHFTRDESRYWLALVQEERASHSALKKSCKEQRMEIRDKQKDLAQRLNYPKLSSASEQARYYRSWLMPALHIAVSIPELRTPGSLAAHFQVAVTDVLQALSELEQLGLVKRVTPQRWNLTGQFLHLDTESPFFSTHHINWRFRSAAHLQQIGPRESLHYTSVVSLAAKDLPRLEELARRFIADAHELISKSKEEKLVCLTLDLFQLGYRHGQKEGNT
jgi:uncharacterized protein (TIGR02147 family)